MAKTPRDFSQLAQDYANAGSNSPFQPEKYFSPEAVRLTNLALAESRRNPTPVDYSYMEMTLKTLDSFEKEDRESSQNAVNEHADLLIALGYSKGTNRFPSDIITTAIDTGNIRFSPSSDFAPITATFKKAEFEIAGINRSVDDAIESAKERTTETATQEIVPETEEEIPVDMVEDAIEEAIEDTAKEEAEAAALEQSQPVELETLPLPAEAEEMAEIEAVEDARAAPPTLLTVDEEITYSEFARIHGVTTEDLNNLNKLDLAENTLIAKGSELYVPANANPELAPELDSTDIAEEIAEAEVAVEDEVKETQLKFPIHFEHVTDPNRVPEQPQSKPDLTERQKEFEKFLDENGKVKTEMPDLTKEQLAAIQEYINEGNARAIEVNENELVMEAGEGVLPPKPSAVLEDKQPAKTNIQSAEFASELSKLLDGVSSNDMEVIKFLQNKGIEFDLPQNRPVIVTSAASAELGQAYLKLHGKELSEEEFVTVAGAILEKGVVVDRDNKIDDVAPDASLNPTQIAIDLQQVTDSGIARK